LPRRGWSSLLPPAAELVGLPVHVLVAVGTGAATAAHRATATTPIVIVNVADPVSSGLIASLAAPGANVTGLTNSVSITGALAGKRLELLAALIPGLSRMAYIVSNPTGPNFGSPPKLRSSPTD
jgi:putative ABC transport system substrate-binding protein